MSLTTGTRLGPYEIQESIGAGGMGEVYRARDTRLDRRVAIKVLPSHLADSPNARQRFEREARAISSLNHQNVCTLHDIGHEGGTDYLVMEYLEGETLAARLAKGPLPAKQFFAYARDICEGLELAHRHGVVHRDLKPGNIMLTRTGAKLMDFGLAKSASLASSADQITTISGGGPNPPVTTEGTVLGTYPYMSPEQLEGREADPRSDIFALGAVLYEMATRHRAFEGKSAASVIAAILDREPPRISASQPASPPGLDRLVSTCLAKDPEERVQSVHDVKLQLEWLAEGVDAGTAGAGTRPRRRWLRWALAALGVLLAAFIVLVAVTPSATWPEMQVSIPLPAHHSPQLLDDDGAGPAVISRDGSTLAFVAADREGRRQIWLRALSDADASALAGTEGATYPFWSPSGKWIGFFADGKLKRIAVSGGTAIAVADAPRGRGGSWGDNGVIVFAPLATSGLYAVADKGGPARQVTKPVEGVHTTHRWPFWIAGGKRFLYLADSHTNATSDRNGIYVATLDGAENRLLTAADSNAVAARGRLIYLQNGSLVAVPFDEARAQLKGDQEVLDQGAVWNRGTWRAAFDASPTGILVTQSGNAGASSRLMWYTPGVVEPRALMSAGGFSELRLSPDAKKLAVNIALPRPVLHLIDLASGVRTRLTFEGISDRNMAWSPDGARIALTETVGPAASEEVLIKDARGGGAQEIVTQGPGYHSVDDWSPDGKYLLYNYIAPSFTNDSIWVVPLSGGDRTPRQIVSGTGPYSVCCARVSPDGKWVAYAARDSASLRQVQVTTFPVPHGKWQISTYGGAEPHWRHDGKAILYMLSDGTVIEAPIALRDNGVDVGAAQAYVKVGIPEALRWGAAWDLAADGRVIVNEVSGQEETSFISLHLAWDADLKK